MLNEGDTITILVVDDNSENLRILKNYLNEEGYSVVITSTEANVLEQAKSVKPNLILLDVSLPGSGGFEVCSKLKQNNDSKHIPIIFTIASPDAENIAKGFEAGGVDYITKPIQKSELFARVKNQLQITSSNQFFEQQLQQRTKELLESDKRFRTAIEGTQDGLWDWNLITNEAFFSEHYETMLGYTPGELPSSGEAWLGLLHPEDKMEAMETLLSYLNKETNKYESTFRMRAKDGKYRWITVRGKAEYDETGKASRIICFLTDISERQEAELKLKKSNEELMEALARIQQINIQLEKARTRSEKSDRLKTAFIANLNHELGTPINEITNFVKLLDDKEISNEKHKQYTEGIQKSSNRMLNHIKNLVDISKIEANEMKYIAEKTNLNEILTKTYIFFKPEADKKGLNLIYKKELKDEESNVTTDAEKLGQILANLVKNAIKFTDKGKVEFGYKILDKTIIFWVEDTGPGIPQGKVDTIFERFRQIEETPFRPERKIGLGLPISKAYVELMSGKIWIDTERKHGTTFYFSLPLNPIDKTEELKEQKEEDYSFSTSTVLVAEDDDINFMFIKEILTMHSIKVMRARNGKEALEAVLGNSAIDLILMDIKMPLMDGLDATKAIINTNKKIPIVAQTAYASAQDKKKVSEAGCVDYITKPIDKFELKRVLEKYLKADIASVI